jgi:ABC-type nickel/cobalt efflux system permease component RcnA
MREHIVWIVVVVALLWTSFGLWWCWRRLKDLGEAERAIKAMMKARGWTNE